MKKKTAKFLDKLFKLGAYRVTSKKPIPGKTMVYGLQRSELLDDKVCEFCKAMDGVVVEPNDKWAQTHTMHEGCRGIWVEIGKEEINPPKITGVTKDMEERFKKIKKS